MSFVVFRMALPGFALTLAYYYYSYCRRPTKGRHPKGEPACRPANNVIRVFSKCTIGHT